MPSSSHCLTTNKKNRQRVKKEKCLQKNSERCWHSPKTIQTIAWCVALKQLANKKRNSTNEFLFLCAKTTLKKPVAFGAQKPLIFFQIQRLSRPCLPLLWRQDSNTNWGPRSGLAACHQIRNRHWNQPLHSAGQVPKLRGGCGQNYVVAARASGQQASFCSFFFHQSGNNLFDCMQYLEKQFLREHRAFVSGFLNTHFE